MTTDHNALYRTTDISLATTLSIWLPLDSVDRSNPRQAWFNFENSEELQKLVELYWRKELQVEPQEYFSQLRMVKARLYERGNHD